MAFIQVSRDDTDLTATLMDVIFHVKPLLCVTPDQIGINTVWQYYSATVCQNKTFWFLSKQEKSKMNFLMVDGAGTEDKPLKIPKEVWILVNHLYTKSCDQVRELQLVSGYANIFSPLERV